MGRIVGRVLRTLYTDKEGGPGGEGPRGRGEGGVKVPWDS